MPDSTTNQTIVSRKPLFTFLGLVTVLSTLIYLLVFSENEENAQGGLALLQFAPALSAIITKLIFKRNVRGLGWKWGKTRYQLVSLILPFGLGLIGFGLVWLLGFGGFYNEAFIVETQTGIAESLGLNITSPYIVMLMLVLVNGTAGLVFAGIFALGEEIGWRGFLVPELYKSFNFTQVGLISGVIWVVYHYPLLIGILAPRLGVSAWPLLITSMIGGIGISYIVAWLRLKSGSLWTAVFFHAALNAHNQGFFQNLTINTSDLTNYISGEYGLMMALVTAAAGYVVWRKRDSLPEPQK